MRAPSHRILGVAIVIVAVGLGFLLIGREDPEPEVRKPQSRAAIERDLREGTVLAGPERAPFAIRFTDDWAGIDRATLGDGEARPVAGLRRKDGSGVLTVTVGGPIRGGISRLRGTLPATLKERFDDFRLVAIRFVRVAAGRALYTSFVREESDQIQTILVVPEGNRRSYQVDAVIRGAAQDTAAQVGVMLGTFDITGR